SLAGQLGEATAFLQTVRTASFGRRKRPGRPGRTVYAGFSGSAGRRLSHSRNRARPSTRAPGERRRPPTDRGATVVFDEQVRADYDLARRKAFWRQMFSRLAG